MTYQTIVTKTSKEIVRMINLADIYDFVSRYYKPMKQEQLLLFTLGESYSLKNVYLVHVGQVREKTMDIKDICYKAIADNAESVIVCYIRSSSSDQLCALGDDFSNARKILKAFKIMNTKVLYQLIIGNNGYTEIKNDENDEDDII
jgi:DNA repair protein RadC